jgi:hypothetical protein
MGLTQPTRVIPAYPNPNSQNDPLSWDYHHQNPVFGCYSMHQAVAHQFFRGLGKYKKDGPLPVNLYERIRTIPTPQLCSLTDEAIKHNGSLFFTTADRFARSWFATGESLIVVRNLMLEFVGINPGLKEALEATEGLYLQHYSPNAFWGVGLQYRGEPLTHELIPGMDGGANWYGIMWMMIRDILESFKTGPPPPVGQEVQEAQGEPGPSRQRPPLLGNDGQPRYVRKYSENRPQVPPRT